MSVEIEVASLKVTVDALSTAIRDTWAAINKLNEGEGSLKLILYKLNELDEKFAAHGVKEDVYLMDYNMRLANLEKMQHEFNGAFKAVVSGVALVSSLIGGTVTVVLGRFITLGHL